MSRTSCIYSGNPRGEVRNVHDKIPLDPLLINSEMNSLATEILILILLRWMLALT